MSGDPRDDPEFRALLNLSARLGRNPLRTQAAGGNTSLKHDGAMWIKASGTWLADAEDRDIMVPVETGRLLAAVAAGDIRAEKGTDFVLPDRGPRGLRPSVETPVHAVIPSRVVLHIHCVDTIALAVRRDAEAVLAERLNGLAGVDWIHVPYVKPGVPLSREIVARRRATTNVVILGNHGLIVAGESVAEAEDRLERVCAALAAPPRPGVAPDLPALARIAAGSAYRLPADERAHDLAMDSDSLALAGQGSLYPDHVVFLGRGVVVLREREFSAEFARLAEGPPMVVIPQMGVLLHRSVLRGADELARCLAEVTARIPGDAALNCITSEQEDELINWEAEIYRLVARPPCCQIGIMVSGWHGAGRSPSSISASPTPSWRWSMPTAVRWWRCTPRRMWFFGTNPIRISMSSGCGPG